MSDQTGNEQKADLAQEILNKILTDADFRRQLLDNPTDTLAQAGYIEGDDVSGYSMMRAMGGAHLTIVPSPSGSIGKPPVGTTGINCGGGGTTAVDCGGGIPGTTAINCGGGGISTTPKPKPPAATDPTNS